MLAQRLIWKFGIVSGIIVGVYSCSKPTNDDFVYNGSYGVIASSATPSSEANSSANPISSSSVPVSSSSLASSSSSSLVAYSSVNYSAMFTPDSCVGLLCQIVNPGELGANYSVPRDSALQDMATLDFTHKTLVPGTESPDPSGLNQVGEIVDMKWEGNRWITNSQYDPQIANYLGGELRFLSNQGIYSGTRVEFRTAKAQWNRNPSITISGTGTLLDGKFLMSYTGGKLVMVESWGKYAIEWTP